MACQHTATTTGRETGYDSSVATPGRTAENRAAHGCITYTETCDACGAERRVNQNQRHIEVSEWGPSLAAQREADARRLRALRAGTDEGYRASNYEYHVHAVDAERVTIRRLSTQPRRQPEYIHLTHEEWAKKCRRTCAHNWPEALDADVRVLRATGGN